VTFNADFVTFNADFVILTSDLRADLLRKDGEKEPEGGRGLV
jgi:hypothetical protein